MSGSESAKVATVFAILGSAALGNIKAMARKRIILGVKLPSARLKKRSRHAHRYSVLDYTEILGSRVTVTACGYLSLLEWEVG